jgi:flagellin
MVINTNASAARGARFLADATTSLQKSLARLSSGSKIVEPQDDAAGLAVSARFEAQINRTDATRTNIGNMVSLMQTRDGYLQKVEKALNRMSELSTLAQDETKGTDDLALYNKEFTTLQAYITDVAGQKFNGNDIFGTTEFETLISDDETGKFKTGKIDLADAKITGASTGIKVDTLAGAVTAFDKVKTAITKTAEYRATLGADLSRLNLTSEHLSVLSENLQSSVSRIKDVDVATESAKYAKYNILVQSGTAMLAQANSLPQSALRLLS